MATLLCILFHFIQIITAYKINLQTSDDNNMKIIKAAVDIANNNFNYRLQTVVYSISNDADELFSNSFVKFYKGVVKMGVKLDRKPTKQVVLAAESFNSLRKIANEVKPDLRGISLLNGSTKFLIVLLKPPYKLHVIMKFFMNYNAVNLIVVTREEDKIALYTFNPFKSHLDCHNSEPKLIGYWKENEKMDPVYPDKMINMRECPLFISTDKLYLPATDQKVPLQIIKRTIVRLLRSIMNFTPIVSERDYISIDSDRAKNWSDSLNDILTGNANLSTCSIPLGEDRLGVLDYSMPYFRVRIAWLAPPIKFGPVWWRMLSPLSSYLWLNIVILVVLVTVLPYLIKVGPIKRFCTKYFRNINQVHGAVIRSWGVLLGQPVRVMPLRFRDFYIVSLWLWFTFFVRSAYQSVLISALKTDTFVGNYANLEETIEHGYRFGGRGGVLSHFEHDPLIKERFEVIPEEKFEKLIMEVIEGYQKFVLATSLEYAWAYCLAEGKTDIECGHVLPDSIIMVPLVVWTKENSPFQRTLSVWLPRLIETGLLYRDEVKKPSSGQSTKTNDPTPLNSQQVLSCLLCLSIGYILAIIAFVFEVMWHKTISTLGQLTAHI